MITANLMKKGRWEWIQDGSGDMDWAADLVEEAGYAVASHVGDGDDLDKCLASVGGVKTREVHRVLLLDAEEVHVHVTTGDGRWDGVIKMQRSFQWQPKRGRRY